MVLETRCEELQKLLDDARGMLDKQQIQRKRRERRKSSHSQSRKESKVGNTDIDDDEEEEVITNEPNTLQRTSPHSDIEDRTRSGCGSRCGSGCGPGCGGSVIQESGYSSGSVESHLHRLADNSDSELSSPERERVPKLSIEDELLLDRYVKQFSELPNSKNMI